MIRFWHAFMKLTGWPAQFICFRTKITCVNSAVQGRRIKGPAMIVSNHTSVFDYAVMLFVFPWRVLRYQMAEVLYEKKMLGRLLRHLGGIYVDRNSHNLGFMRESADILAKGGVVGVFPEGRLPKEGETPPLEFLPGAAYLALSTGVKVIPVYTNGSYFNLKKRARVVIGEPIDPAAFNDPAAGEKENIRALTEAMRSTVIALGKTLDAR